MSEVGPELLSKSYFWGVGKGKFCFHVVNPIVGLGLGLNPRAPGIPGCSGPSSSSSQQKGDPIPKEKGTNQGRVWDLGRSSLECVPRSGSAWKSIPNSLRAQG